MEKVITLKEYLSLIVDEDLRVELEIYGEDDYYSRESFWLSDFRVGLHSDYSEWTVEYVSFMPDDSSAEILIQIKP